MKPEPPPEGPLTRFFLGLLAAAIIVGFVVGGIWLLTWFSWQLVHSPVTGNYN